MKYDVVVVGSGPSGSVTARYAAENGAEVLVIERRAEVGVPVLCGEGISRKIDEWKILEGKRWIAGKMDGARIYSPDGTCVTLAAEQAGNETGYVVYRDIFDQELARSAIKAGAEFMMNTKAVGLIKDGDKINLDINKGIITVGSKNFSFPKLPVEILAIRNAGGLLNYTRERLKNKK